MPDIEDEVYGRVSVTEELLCALLATGSVQRLKRVSQAGASSLLRQGRDVTRYEHSVGVMALTGILGGDVTEQAAGLLQDLSHTAFSHTIDYVFDDRREEFHERIFQSVIESGDVPAVLARYDLTWQQLFSEPNLTRVDVPAPLLCADRIDYTLRDLVRFGYISPEQARSFVSTLRFVDGKIAIAGIDVGMDFLAWYRHLVGEIFMNPLELYAHGRMAEIIRSALRYKVIDEVDLLATDDVVLAKLEADAEHGLASDLLRLRTVRSVAVGDPQRGRRVHSKARMVDPPVLLDGSVAPLSELKSDTADSWHEIEETARNGVFVGPPD